MNAHSRPVCGWRVSPRALLVALLLAVLPVAPSPAVSRAQPGGPAALIEDDFSSNDSGWLQEDVSYWKVGYDSEEYFVVTFPVPDRTGAIFSFGFLVADFGDILAEVDVRLPSGRDDERAALGVRWSERGFVGVTIAPALGRCGLVRFTRDDSGVYRGAALVPEAECAAIRVGPGFNRLALRAEGDQFEGFVNGYRVVSAADDQFTSGGFALAVSGPASSLTEGRFDNFRVTAVGP